MPLEIEHLGSRKGSFVQAAVLAGVSAGLVLLLAGCQPRRIDIANPDGSEPLNGSGYAQTVTPTPIALGDPSAGSSRESDLGNVAQWSKVEIVLKGPVMDGMDSAVNPFRVQLDVIFIGPEGESFAVPAFFDGNGAGGLEGNVWKVRFSPPQVGTWQFISHSTEPLLDGQAGSLHVAGSSECQRISPGALPDFRCVGRLGSAEAHYLKFDSGPYWLKGGVDDPEDFLAPAQSVGMPSKEAAVDYLASVGVNSMYIMTMNVGGDGRNVWPWIGRNEREVRANSERFDVVRLAEWEKIFEYVQSHGIVLHLVLEDDSGWTGFNRQCYYREMVARFGHHNGLIWNLSEEYNENYSASQMKQFAQSLRDLDPYEHPITVHHAGGTRSWEPFLGDERFDLTSFQSDDRPQNTAAVKWYRRVSASGRTIPVSFDETGKIESLDRDLARHIVWSVYLGGGNLELHTSPLADYRDFSAQFEDLSRARQIMESQPFWAMSPRNDLMTTGVGYVLASEGQRYLIYLPYGGEIGLDLSSANSPLRTTWVDPATGEQQHGIAVPGVVNVLSSPFVADAVLVIAADSD